MRQLWREIGKGYEEAPEIIITFTLFFSAFLFVFWTFRKERFLVICFFSNNICFRSISNCFFFSAVILFAAPEEGVDVSEEPSELSFNCRFLPAPKFFRGLFSLVSFAIFRLVPVFLPLYFLLVWLLPRESAVTKFWRKLSRNFEKIFERL